MHTNLTTGRNGHLGHNIGTIPLGIVLPKVHPIRLYMGGHHLPYWITFLKQLNSSQLKMN